MPLVADQDDGVTLTGVLDRLEMHLGDQGARGVDGKQAPLASLVANLGRDTVGAVEQGGALGHFLERLDEDRAALLEPLDHVLVVHDLMIDVDRCAEELEGALQALDGHVDTGAEASRVGENDFHRGWKTPSSPG